MHVCMSMCVCMCVCVFVYIFVYACEIVKVVASVTILLLISTSHQYGLVFCSS